VRRHAASFGCPSPRSSPRRMTLLLLVKRGRVSISGCNAIFIGPVRCFLRWHRRSEAGSMTSTVHALNQASQHAANFMQGCIKRFMLFFGKEPKVTGEQQKILQFTRRPGGEIQELTQLGLAASGAALRHVCRYRSRRSPHLAGNAVPLGIWERTSRHVDAEDEGMALLPNLKLLKILHSSSEFPFSGGQLQLTSFQLAQFDRVSQTPDVCVYLTLIANNCQQKTGTRC
jgi:hypothetical protein